LSSAPDLLPRFNIAPGQAVAVVREKPQAEGRKLVFLRWGLIPAWADDPAIGNRLANARSETASTKPSFRRAFRSRRCLVVADGFYEWQRTNGRKQPYFVGLKNDHPFGMAGLWERWERQVITPTPLETGMGRTSRNDVRQGPGCHARCPDRHRLAKTHGAGGAELSKVERSMIAYW
jgi:putative SOS response-associated peptidase YedK